MLGLEAHLYIQQEAGSWELCCSIAFYVLCLPYIKRQHLLVCFSIVELKIEVVSHAHAYAYAYARASACSTRQCNQWLI